jgi:hypothetical protein
MREPKREKLRSVRRALPLCSALEKSLSAYASAALAAGVSVLAMTNPAEARIVYTPAHTKIPFNENAPVHLDLNHDGIADFNLWNMSPRTCFSASCAAFQGLEVGCALRPIGQGGGTCRYQKNEVWGKGGTYGRFASALPAGFSVRAKNSYFRQGKQLVIYGSAPPVGPVASVAGVSAYAWQTGFWSRSFGQFCYTHDRYLGLQFVIKGRTHYGWARLSVSLVHPKPKEPAKIHATLTGYAYETIPGKPIITGKTKGPDVVTFRPATLGHLAAGASAIPTSRSGR